MNIGQKGVDLIKSFEGLRLEAYMPTPEDVPTIGYGSTQGVQMGDVIDEQQAEEMLREDLREAENCLDSYVEVELTQGQFDALCSLVFNIGCSAFKNSTLCRVLNAEDYAGAALQFGRWNRQGKKVLAGLTRRRAAEAELFGVA